MIQFLRNIEKKKVIFDLGTLKSYHFDKKNYK